jgi:hypothetical protein
MNDDNWIMPDGLIDPTTLDLMPVIIRTKIGQDVKGILHLEGQNDKGQIRLFASFNSSPFANMVRNEVFYLTQEQLIEYQFKGAKCILVAPQKISN